MRPRFPLNMCAGRRSLEEHLWSRLEDMIADAGDADLAWLREASLDEALDPEVWEGALYDPDIEDEENLLVSRADMPVARVIYSWIRDEMFLPTR